MLAQNFKSATDLDLTDRQRDALIKVLVLLETDKLTHVEKYERFLHGANETFTGHFNMGLWNMPTECGTVGCIGGTAELISGEDFSSFETTGHSIEALFWPGALRPIWSSITPAQAATALRSYLQTDDPRWDLALSRSSRDNSEARQDG